MVLVFFFLCVCGDLHPFLLCAVIASHILEKNPQKKSGIRLEFLPPTSVRCSCDRSQVVVSSSSRISFHS